MFRPIQFTLPPNATRELAPSHGCVDCLSPPIASHRCSRSELFDLRHRVYSSPNSLHGNRSQGRKPDCDRYRLGRCAPRAGHEKALAGVTAETGIPVLTPNILTWLLGVQYYTAHSLATLHQSEHKGSYERHEARLATEKSSLQEPA
jgi:hypothetical protein